ncbi:MAG TPA: STAS domain-containing protein [Solirubrobacteraceae bacterium]|nr:STAS domain-containing protein [Solirubrobacteraceae bacterium]
MLHERIYVFELTARGPYAIVHAGGELDIATVGDMRSAVRRAAWRSSQVVVDLRAVTFMDTFVLHALVVLQHEASTATDWSLHVVPGIACSACSTLPAGAASCAGSHPSS